MQRKTSGVTKQSHCVVRLRENSAGTEGQDKGSYRYSRFILRGCSDKSKGILEIGKG